MGFNLISENLDAVNTFWRVLWENVEKYGKTAVFPGGYGRIREIKQWQLRPELGSIGLTSSRQFLPTIICLVLILNLFISYHSYNSHKDSFNAALGAYTFLAAEYRMVSSAYNMISEFRCCRFIAPYFL